MNENRHRKALVTSVAESAFIIEAILEKMIEDSNDSNLLQQQRIIKAGSLTIRNILEFKILGHGNGNGKNEIFWVHFEYNNYVSQFKW